MRKLNLQEVDSVNGGFWGTVVLLVAILSLPKPVRDKAEEYAKYGVSFLKDIYHKFYPRKDHLITDQSK